MRLPEPRGRELLLEVRLHARQGREQRDDDDLRARGSRRGARPRGQRDRRPALVVRSGGGRAGESFVPSAERTLIGRSPECDVFLDDVTVSRRHAELVRSGGRSSFATWAA